MSVTAPDGSGNPVLRRMKAELHQEAELERRATSWSFPAWVKAYPLTPSTVLDYFRQSVFYDKSCNNEIIAMQQAGADRITQLEGLEYELEANTVDCVLCHRSTPAAQILCAHCGESAASMHDQCGNCRSSLRGRPHCPVCSLFILKKQARLDPMTVRLQSVYYVIGADGQKLPRGTILAMADLQSVLRTNLYTAAFFAADVLPDIARAYHQRHEQFIAQYATPDPSLLRPEQHQQQRSQPFQAPGESHLQKGRKPPEPALATRPEDVQVALDDEVLRTEMSVVAQPVLLRFLHSLPRIPRQPQNREQLLK